MPQVTVAEGVQLATPTGLVHPHVVVVQLLAKVAAAAVQPRGTEVGPVVLGVGQVVVTQLLPEDAAETVHDAVGVGPVVAVPQVVVG